MTERNILDGMIDTGMFQIRDGRDQAIVQNLRVFAVGASPDSLAARLMALLNELSDAHFAAYGIEPKRGEYILHDHLCWPHDP